MKNLFLDLLAILSLGGLSYGFYLIKEPLGIIIPCSLLLVYSILASFGGDE